jgi:hypothetical protein
MSLHYQNKTKQKEKHHRPACGHSCAIKKAIQSSNDQPIHNKALMTMEEGVGLGKKEKNKTLIIG